MAGETCKCDKLAYKTKAVTMHAWARSAVPLVEANVQLAAVKHGWLQQSMAGASAMCVAPVT